MILDYDFYTDEDNREPVPADKGFPFVIKYTDFSKMIGGRASWHWHDFFEITIPLQNGMQIQSSNSSAVLNKGEAVFLNSSMLHTVNWINSENNPATYTFFFDRSILSGAYDSIFDDKFVSPVALCRDLEFFVLKPDHREGLIIMSLLQDIVEMFNREPFGYEMSARSSLSQFWLLLLKETEGIRKKSGRTDSSDNLRMKKMLNFLHEHYSEKIYIDDIASSAGISSRECTRCFKRQIGHSPMDYLNQYRVRIAAKELRSGDKPVSMIGEECGFASDSYFGKTFRQIMNCTPRDYRKGESAVRST